VTVRADGGPAPALDGARLPTAANAGTVGHMHPV